MERKEFKQPELCAESERWFICNLQFAMEHVEYLETNGYAMWYRDDIGAMGYEVTLSDTSQRAGHKDRQARKEGNKKPQYTPG